VDEATAVVAARADDVARRALELLGEAAPFDAATLDARGRRLLEADAGLHVRALAGSVAAEDPTIFADYAVWAAELLSRFGIAADQLAALFAAIGRSVAELVPSAAAVVDRHLEAGERALAR
jgi:hypothetical protein